MVEANFIERRGGRVGRDVAADTVGRSIGTHDHGHGVPAYEALDSPLDFLAAGQRRFLGCANGIDIRRDRAERQADALRPRVVSYRRQQPMHALAIALLNDVVKRLSPLPLFECLELGIVLGCDIPHVVKSYRI
jgi:hypothetical protein